MKILFLASRFPYPATKGDQLRVWHLLKQLKRLGHEVTFVCTTEDDLNLRALDAIEKEVSQAIICRFGIFERYWQLLLAPLRRLPFQVAYFQCLQMQNVVNKQLENVKYDAVFCQMVRTAPYINLKQYKGIKIIDFQDAYSLNMQKRYLSEKGLVRWVAWVEWKLLAGYEKRLASKFDVALIISQRDKDVINHPGISVLKNGVSIPMSRKYKKEPFSMVFSGNLKYFPNREAIVHFAHNVYPIIKHKIPRATLTIVGATPPEDVELLVEINGVKVIANPKEMVPHISKAMLAIAPMRSGSGLQNKVLEAWSASTAVVMTEHALDGLGEISESCFEVASDDPRQMADIIVTLLNDEKRCIGMGIVGYEVANSHYSWSVVGENLNKLLSSHQKVRN